jgi:hypothetical protein
VVGESSLSLETAVCRPHRVDLPIEIPAGKVRFFVHLDTLCIVVGNQEPRRDERAGVRDFLASLWIARILAKVR